MGNSLAAFAIFALLGAAVVALPVFAPKVEARETPALAKGDRLDVRPIIGICLKQVWPTISARCLKNADGQARVQEARLVASRR
jgi:hypothetical protein